jgi:hypothetical protein
MGHVKVTHYADDYLLIKKIIKTGYCTQFFFQDIDPFFTKNIIKGTVFIQDITKNPGSGRTDIETCGVQPLPGTSQAKCAFFHYTLRPDSVAQIRHLCIYIFLI